ncbi:MAG TPA: hypothetical protein VK838_00225 [Candidatus Limnocylindrales bacterium]|nr:hypothetical protein [Candidatus Limnocylindrales bacterium]
MKNEFGPNQAQVDAFLERLETVDQGQALFLAGLGGGDPAREMARKALTDAARRGGRERERQLKAAQDEVIRWMNTWFSGGFEIAGYGRDITPAQAVVAASPVVLDAIGALVLSDLLETDDHDALIGPWLELLEGDG